MKNDFSNTSIQPGYYIMCLFMRIETSKMAQEGLSPNSDWILVEKEGNDFEKLETNFEKLQKEFVEEKGKTVNLKRKNDFLENELKEMDLKIQKINSDHKKEIEEIKQNFQKLIEENKQSKTENNEKINYLEEKIKKTNDLFEKKFGDLIKLNNLTGNKYANFIKIKNKWSEIEYICKCCSNKCNKNKPNGINGNGYGNIINGENIKYINCLEGGKNFIVMFMQKIHLINLNIVLIIYYIILKLNVILKKS
uniref:Uncharacterized protein n=1 Tax=Meloidogyne enterolobii TaxID=390850 RepID=A0A6V7WWZ6_MELEN|nr:unnamed protein product [Meloidogyne enterolobii]